MPSATTMVASIALAVSALVLPAGAGTASTVAPVGQTALAPDAEASFRAFLAAYGVDGAVQDSLVATLDAGGQIDAFGGTPVEVTQTITPTSISTVSTYADGSISATTLEQPGYTTGSQVRGTAPEPLSVGGCTSTVSTTYQRTYQNCDVSSSNGLVTMSFTAGYTLFQGGGRIDYVQNPRAWSSTYGTASQTLAVTRQYSSGSMPATALHTATFHPTGTTTLTCWVQLNVLGSAYTTDNI